MKVICYHSTEFFNFGGLLPTWNFENNGEKREGIQGKENKLSDELAT